MSASSLNAAKQARANAKAFAAARPMLIAAVVSIAAVAVVIVVYRKAVA
jgi:hypothetical protein